MVFVKTLHNAIGLIQMKCFCFLMVCGSNRAWQKYSQVLFYLIHCIKALCQSGFTAKQY